MDKNVNNKPFEDIYNLNQSINYIGCSGSDTIVELCGNENRGFCCRCAPEHRIQTRGGQSCRLKSDEEDLVIHASTHCIRFNPLYYGVYKLFNPKIYQRVSLQFYEGDIENQNKWKYFMKDSPIQVGTDSTFKKDKNDRLSVHYKDIKYMPDKLPIDSDRKKLLIPFSFHFMTDKQNLKQTLKQRQPKNFLIIDRESIDIGNSSCDKIGMNAKAFIKMMNPCLVPKY